MRKQKSGAIELIGKQMSLNKNIVITSIYKPSNTTIADFNDEHILNILENENKFVSITGDFNINTILVFMFKDSQTYLTQLSITSLLVYP